MVTYDEVARRLTAEAEALYERIIEAHLASAGSPHRHFLTSTTNVGAKLIFAGRAPWTQDVIDTSALHDLIDYGLVRVQSRPRGNEFRFDVSGESLSFYRYLRAVRGGPFTLVETSVRSLVDVEAMASRHPAVSENLGKAFDLLWSDRLDPQTVSDMGTSLRDAIVDAAGHLHSGKGSPEKVSDMVRTLGKSRRDVAAIAELVALAQRLNHRLAHIREEAADGRPLLGWDELRRACWATVFCCYELVHLPPIDAPAM